MATDIEQWFCKELGDLGIDATEENARYILSMEDVSDLEDYMTELLDSSDPKVRLFLQELKRRWKPIGSNNVRVYQKDRKDVHQTGKQAKQNNEMQHISQSRSNPSQPTPTNGMSKHNGLSHSATKSGGEIGIGAKKKSTFVPLFSKEGEAKSVIQLKGRHKCECQAAKHKLVNNCTRCGRIVCVQEGVGPCVFCGNLVCTPEDQEVISRGSKKGEKLRQYLMKGPVNPSLKSMENLSPLPSAASQPQQYAQDALKHRDKLLEFDRSSAQRTQVIDDECDYFATNSNQWLSKDNREKLREREEELRQARHGSRRNRKITLDFAGRRVVEPEEEFGRAAYSREDMVVQEVHYGKSSVPTSGGADLVNPTVLMEPQFVGDSSSSNGGHLRKMQGSQVQKSSNHTRIQDRELQEMRDSGMCLSMHQPYASLLVCGIKMHEGRTWYSSHRGRLWIAATVQTPDREKISELEHTYRNLYSGKFLDFPKDYPSGCLLGCVNVEDCLDQEEYRIKYSGAESVSESVSPYVFICSNPQELTVKFPMSGKHKIYKLESHIHRAAKKGLR